MKRLFPEDLEAIIGKTATRKLLEAHPHLFTQQALEGDVHENVPFRRKEPWSGTTLDLQINGNWVTFGVPAKLIDQTRNAIGQANALKCTLGVRVSEGLIEEIWITE